MNDETIATSLIYISEVAGFVYRWLLIRYNLSRANILK
jgi:hypothetical protein